jgi:hypothetical protein
MTIELPKTKGQLKKENEKLKTELAEREKEVAKLESVVETAVLDRITGEKPAIYIPTDLTKPFSGFSPGNFALTVAASIAAYYLCKKLG